MSLAAAPGGAAPRDVARGDAAPGGTAAGGTAAGGTAPGGTAPGGTAPGAAARAVVVDAPLSVAEHEEMVASRTAGAVVSFAGVVRDHDSGRVVTELEYVGHPSAQQVLAEIAAEFAALDDVVGVAVSHRVGLLGIGDVALACAVSTAHRAEAFALCARLVDEVKARLPIWKRQTFADGADEWVACP